MDSAMDRTRIFTLRELAEFDGTDGRPAYIAFNETVYDVSQVELWNEGSHFNQHMPGSDLTEQMGRAPHAADVLDRPGIKIVGVLKGGVKKDSDKVHIPSFLETIFRLFPSMRRHTHPATVHFPIAFLAVGSIFTVLELLSPDLFRIDHERIAFLMLILATIFTPITIATGVFSWWVNYQFRPSMRIRNLIGLSAVILVLEAVSLIMRIPGPVAKEGAGLLYYGIMLLMGPLVVITAFNGGQIVFPTHR